MDIQALAFDTGGTVLDWHGGLVAALKAVGSKHGADTDWHAVANDWRRRSMKGIVGQVNPEFHMDDVHRRALDDTLAHFGLDAFTPDERVAVWRTWHALDAWPDFPGALAALRTWRPVVSFTMLPTSLVVDVSRKNGIDLGRHHLLRDDRRVQTTCPSLRHGREMVEPGAGTDPDGRVPQLRPQRGAQGRVSNSVHSPAG